MRKKLKEVCDFYSGTGFPVKFQGENDGELPFYKVGDIANNATAGNVYLSLCNNFISHDVAKEIKGTIIPSDVVVFAKIGEALKLNRRAITACDCLIDNNAMGIGGKSEYLNSMYFYFYMKNLKMETLAESTTVPSVRKTKLEEIEIDVPTLVEQSEIVDILAKLQKVINERQEQLEKLDELIKARFVEMFGDPVSDTKSWGQKSLREMLKSIRYGTSTPPEFSDEGYAFIRATNIKNGQIVDNDMKFIPQQEADRLEKCRLSGGEIIIVRSGVNAGDTCVVTPEYIGQYAGYDMILVLNEMLNPVFLNTLINTSYMEKVVKPMTRRAAQPHLNSEQTQSFPIICVPKALQDEFAEFVKQVDKSKVAVRRALDETQILYDSLMQEYFG